MNRTLLKILQATWVIQSKTEIFKYNNPDLGRDIRHLKRLNPFNPLTYITIIIVLIVGIILYGFVGVWREVEIINSFKWQ